VLVAVAAGVLALSSVQAFSGETAVVPLQGKITLVGHLTEYHLVKSDSVGRETYFFSLQSQRRKGRPFGYATLACAFVSTANSLRQCNGTFALPRGRVVISGNFLYLNFFRLAITGGTDDYTAVQGVVTFRIFPKSENTGWFSFDLR